MPEIAMVWRLAGALYGIITIGIGWWVSDLKDKHKRAVSRQIVYLKKSVTIVND